jgi:serine/threonine-protein kinase
LALDQQVAIKVLTEAEGTTEAEWAEDAERFRREAMATATLKSEHVVRVLDVDVLKGGYPYIVMEYLDGKTLHDLTYTSRSPLKCDDVADYGIQMLAALADAHAAGFVHRDLKPANVFLAKGVTGAPLVKVLDFGVSKVLASASLRLTRTGAVVGTLAYMAPEQMRDARRVDGRADLWSVGVVLYEALARQHPFGAHTAGPKAVTAILNNPVPPLANYRPDVPPGLEAVIQRLLEKTAERRYATAAEAALALAPFASPRARPVLDEILRTPPPCGPASPELAAPGRESRKSLPQGPPEEGSSPVIRFFVAFAAATIVLGFIAFAVLYARQHFLR